VFIIIIIKYGAQVGTAEKKSQSRRRHTPNNGLAAAPRLLLVVVGQVGHGSWVNYGRCVTSNGGTGLPERERSREREMPSAIAVIVSVVGSATTMMSVGRSIIVK